MSQAGDLDRALKRIERHLADARPGTHDHERWSRQHRLALEALEELDRADVTECRCDPETGIYAHDRDGCAGRYWRDPATYGHPRPGPSTPSSTTTDAAGRDPLEHPDT